VSVGNLSVGGSGKTPVVFKVIETLLKNGYRPVVISKSYKAKLKAPQEVKVSSDPLVVGDEAHLIKKTNPEVPVFSGPIKYKTALFAQRTLENSEGHVFIIDDGAQHHRIKKDIKIHLWDMSRPLIDFFPFPLGLCREFWFLGESPDIKILNRVQYMRSSKLFKPMLFGKKIELKYQTKSIINPSSGEGISKDAILVSGVGNFEQLRQSVSAFMSSLGLKLIGEIKGQDHDSFDWFRPEDNISYICTEKDFTKLKPKISKEGLFVARGEFEGSKLDEALNELLLESLKQRGL
jgi:tetraacyldisaccharide 4'-kinase